jgi:hypothetical protein
VESADHHAGAERPELVRQIARTRKLVGLHADQRDHHPPAGPAVPPDQSDRVEAIHRLVERLGPHAEVTQFAGTHGVLGETDQAVQRVARQDAAPVPDDIPVVVVLRGTDEQQDQIGVGDRRPHATSGGVRGKTRDCPRRLRRTADTPVPPEQASPIMTPVCPRP